jgi:hypothetical protein
LVKFEEKKITEFSRKKKYLIFVSCEIFFPEHYDNLLYAAFDFFSREFPYISAINLTLLIFVRNNSKIQVNIPDNI